MTSCRQWSTLAGPVRHTLNTASKYRIQTMSAPHSNQPYKPWRSTEYPLLQREITSLCWTVARGLQIEVSEHYSKPACLRIGFPRVCAFQAIDEGYRLRDVAIGDALIYSSESSRYLQA